MNEFSKLFFGALAIVFLVGFATGLMLGILLTSKEKVHERFETRQSD